ncbi:MAG: hypothetical protein PHG23_02350, partial [Candidatus Pacebacteria bacterium]|nr:hypothetical protein [Candidatus Paceibacterota bacterium]
MSKKNIFFTIGAIVVIIAVIVLGNYFILNNKAQEGGEQQNQEQTPNGEDIENPVTGNSSLNDGILLAVGKANSGKLQEALSDYLALEAQY